MTHNSNKRPVVLQVSHIIGRKLRTTTIESTADLRDFVSSVLRSETEMRCGKCFLRRAQFWLIAETLKVAFSETMDSEGILMHYEDKESGGIIVTLREVLKHLETIWSVVREDLIWVQSMNNAAGIVIELNFFDWNQASVSEGLFEYAFWGCDSNETGRSLSQLGKLV